MMQVILILTVISQTFQLVNPPHLTFYVDVIVIIKPFLAFALNCLI